MIQNEVSDTIIKHFVIILSALIVQQQHACAQMEFAPVGATWYYTYNGFTVMGYEKLYAEKDTVINSQSCRKLSRIITIYDFITHGTYTGEWSPFFVRDSSGVYYFFQNNQFVLLYDFNKNAGEFWMTDAYSFDGSCKLGKIYVDSTGFELVDGIPLKWLAVHNDSTLDGYFGSGRKIYERMGSLFYMFPVPACFIYEGGWDLRCYSDSTMSYQVFDCDSLYIGIDEISPLDEAIIFPNPAKDFLQVQSISFFNGKAVQILNPYGRIVKSIKIDATSDQISVSDLPNGIYFLKTGKQLSKFVKE